MIVDRWVDGLRRPGRHLARTPCATPSPRTCSRAAPTCAPCRSCSATPAWPRPRSTRTSPTPPLRSAYRSAHPALGPGRRRPARRQSDRRPPRGGRRRRNRGRSGSARAPSAGRVLANASLILTVAALASRLLGWIRLLVIGSPVRRQPRPRRVLRRLPHPRRHLPAGRRRGAVGGADPRLQQLPRTRATSAEAWRLASSVINLVLIALAASACVMADLGAAARADHRARLRRADHRADDPHDPADAAQPGLHRDGRGGQRPPEQLRALRRAGLAPLAYNLAIIAAAIFLAPIMGVEGLAVGVALGSLAAPGHPAAAAAQGRAAITT